MARILDTTPGFEEFARKAFLETPAMRDQLWRERYEGAYQEVFEAFLATANPPEGTNPLVRELTRVRQQATEGGQAMKQVIEEVDPALAGVLDLPVSPSPLHVLMVGRFSTNAAVGRLGEDVVLFHCLEWFRSTESARVMVAHEGTHAWHEVALGLQPPEDDAAWTAFYEGLAIQASKAIVPDRAEDDYFWYGHAGFEEWLPWCREHREELMERFAESLDDPGAPEMYFRGGLVEGKWRVGYFLADQLVESMSSTVPELARMSVDEGRSAIKAALEAS